jgi:hypothetical protein
LYDLSVFSAASRLRAPNTSGIEIAARAVSVTFETNGVDASYLASAVSVCQAKNKKNATVEITDLEYKLRKLLHYPSEVDECTTPATLRACLGE